MALLGRLLTKPLRLAAAKLRSMARLGYRVRLGELRIYLNHLGELARSDTSLSGERAEELAVMMRQVKAEIIKLEIELL